MQVLMSINTPKKAYLRVIWTSHIQKVKLLALFVKVTTFGVFLNFVTYMKMFLYENMGRAVFIQKIIWGRTLIKDPFLI